MNRFLNAVQSRWGHISPWWQVAAVTPLWFPITLAIDSAGVPTTIMLGIGFTLWGATWVIGLLVAGWRGPAVAGAMWASDAAKRAGGWAFGLSTLLTLGWLLVLSVVPTHEEPGAAFLALIIIVVLVATLMIPRRDNGRRYRWVRLLTLALLIALVVTVLAIFGVTPEVVGHGVSTTAVTVWHATPWGGEHTSPPPAAATATTTTTARTTQAITSSSSTGWQRIVVMDLEHNQVVTINLYALGAPRGVRLHFSTQSAAHCPNDFRYEFHNVELDWTSAPSGPGLPRLSGMPIDGGEFQYHRISEAGCDEVIFTVETQ